MAISNVTRNPITNQLVSMRGQLEELQRQLGTGARAETYGGLGSERTLSISFRSRLANLESYSATSDQLNLRIKLLNSSLTRLSAVPTDIRAALDPNAYQVRLDGRTDAQKTARIALDEVVGLLNSEADGRYLFSGRETDTKPVIDVQRMLQGDGAKDGLMQVTAERLTADLGVGGKGRLEIATTAATVSLSRQTPLSAEFGFKISDAETTSGGITITQSGSPVTSVDFAVSGTVNAGDTVTLELQNPDGTTSAIKLKATLSATPAAGEFTIGATVNDTAANMGAALTVAVDRAVATDLKAASAMRAGQNFFDTLGGKAPQRVDATSGGGSLASAVSLRDGTQSDTVFWYRGYNGAIDPSDPSTLPRSDSVARVDTSIDVSYGARANEEGLRRLVQSLAVTAVAQFSGSVATDEDRYRALIERTRDGLAAKEGVQRPQDIHAEIAVAGKIAIDTAARNKINKSSILEMLDGTEGVKLEEIAAQIRTLQTRMQASYQTTSLLSELSLVNYM
jgi:flagellar hook-associated protein 3 FlgL